MPDDRKNNLKMCELISNASKFKIHRWIENPVLKEHVMIRDWEDYGDEGKYDKTDPNRLWKIMKIYD